MQMILGLRLSLPAESELFPNSAFKEPEGSKSSIDGCHLEICPLKDDALELCGSLPGVAKLPVAMRCCASQCELLF